MLSFQGLPVLALAVISFTACPVLASSVPITFEGLADGISVGATYHSSGVDFVNATVITAGISLNESEFPPHSGLNVATDDGGPVTILFSSPIDDFSGFFTYAEALQLIAFDASHTQVASASSLFSENYTSSGNPSNEFMELAFVGGISSVTITGDPSGGSFVVDDISYDLGGSSVPTIPEPSTIWLLSTGIVASLKIGRSARQNTSTQI